MNQSTPKSTIASDWANADDRAIVHSALWSAAGDALGWITELSHNTAGVLHRSGVERVLKPISWKRLVSGRYGPRITLAPGTYSDDTQLRLAVARSIRGDGSFDVEAFAKIELTVWPTYALGAGLGTKAAAASLSRRAVSWFSNFFDYGKKKYIDSGGNGAAMRIQPHVWAASGDHESLMLDVLRDALVTHGHPHGFCGAVFHALCLHYTIQHRELPRFTHAMHFIDRFKDMPRLISHDPQLASFWQPTWEANTGTTVKAAIEKTLEDYRKDFDIVKDALDTRTKNSYRKILAKLGCLTPEFRGTGFKTALAAFALTDLYRDQSIEDCLEVAANELGSDTDTIATMAGAVLGAVSSTAPDWPIQDKGYIVKEARRLSAIARGQPQDSFTYPDLSRWNPPVNQNASIGWSNDQLSIAGLGQLTPQGEEYRAHGGIWQWYALPFGQTVFAKRKTDLHDRVVSTQLPGPRQKAHTHVIPRVTELKHSPHQGTLGFVATQRPEIAERAEKSRPSERPIRSPSGTVDSWSEEAISSGFDNLTLGRLLNRCIDHSGSVETTIAFAAIVAKAKIARGRRDKQ